jgi:hypothetical protein
VVKVGLVHDDKWLVRGCPKLMSREEKVQHCTTGRWMPFIKGQVSKWCVEGEVMCVEELREQAAPACSTQLWLSSSYLIELARAYQVQYRLRY